MKTRLAAAMVCGVLLVACAEPAPSPTAAPIGPPANVAAQTPSAPNAEAQKRLEAARTALRANDLALAQKEAEAAVAADAKSSEAHYVLGNVHNQAASLAADLGQRQQALAKALEAYQKAISLDPKHDAAMVNMGTVFYQNGQFDEAQKSVEAGLQVNPNDATSQYILGTIHLQRDPQQYPDAIDKAKVAFEKAIQLDPKMPVAYTGLATVLLFKNDFRNAQINAQKAIDLAPGTRDPYVFWALAQAQCLGGDRVNGAKTLAIINSLNPQDQRFVARLRELAEKCK